MRKSYTLLIVIFIMITGFSGCTQKNVPFSPKTDVELAGLMGKVKEVRTVKINPPNISFEGKVQYDEKGNIVYESGKTIAKDPPASISILVSTDEYETKYLYTFDDKSRITQKETVKTEVSTCEYEDTLDTGINERSESFHEQFKFNDGGYLIEKIDSHKMHYGKEFRNEKKTEYNYNSSGSLKVKNEYSWDNDKSLWIKIATETRTFDSYGRETSMTWQKGTGAQGVYKYTYNKNGNLILEDDGREKTSNTYNKKNLLTESVVTEGEDLLNKHIYYYNENGQLIKEHTEQKYLSLNIDKEYAYDDRGNVTEYNMINIKGSFFRRIVYEYDEQGNMIKSKEYSSSEQDVEKDIDEEITVSYTYQE